MWNRLSLERDNRRIDAVGLFSPELSRAFLRALRNRDFSSSSKDNLFWDKSTDSNIVGISSGSSSFLSGVEVNEITSGLLETQVILRFMFLFNIDPRGGKDIKESDSKRIFRKRAELCS